MKNEFPKLTLPEWFDERMEAEMSPRGYLSHSIVEVEDGKRYEVFFYDAISLKQVSESEIKLNRPYVAEIGMIVLPEVTLKNIYKAIKSLAKEGYFEKLKEL
ncbi:hypothetical protein BH24ACI2_BH24ACI2_04040 [soil metagenome]|jgi:hypothetical protein|nr:hypothetical protein [Acidobacteriota bacterium]